MRTLAILLALTIPALAQDHQWSPSQAAIQIETVINQLAGQLEACSVDNQKAQAQVKDLQAKLDELKKDPK